MGWTTDKYGHEHCELEGWRITITKFANAPDVVTASCLSNNEGCMEWRGQGIVFQCDDGTGGFNVPYNVMHEFMQAIELPNARPSFPEEPADMVPQVPVAAQPYTLQNLVDDYIRGEFDPNRWNMCIDYNGRDVGEKTECGNPKYTKHIGFYVMGTGCGQCLHKFYWRADDMPYERLESWIKLRFGVDRVLNGVG